MDWASNEPAHDSGLFFVPEEAGHVSLLEEPGRGSRGAPPFSPLSDPAGLSDGGAALPGPGGCGGFRGRGPGREREGFYGGVVSDRGNQPAIEDADWDPRPLRFNPRAGPAWARFVPTERQRPHRGGPGPYQAFPMVTQDEAQVNPRDLFAPRPGAGAGAPMGPGLGLGGVDLPTCVLLLILVVLAAQLVSVERRLGDLSLLLACRPVARERAAGPAA